MTAAPIASIAPSAAPGLVVRILAGPFVDLLARASVFAGQDDTLPMLAGVQVWVEDGRLWAAATDRYAVAFAFADLYAPPGETAVSAPSGPPLLLPLDAIRRALYVFKPTRSDSHLPLEIAFPGPPADDVEASLAGGVVTVTDRTGTRVAFHTYAGNVPPMKSVIDLTAYPQDAGVRPDLGISPKLLARFAKVARRVDDPMRIRFPKTPAKPILVALGDDFLALVMPVRLPDWAPVASPRPDAFAPWADLLHIESPAAPPALPIAVEQ